MMASQGFLTAIEKIYYRVLVHNQEGYYNSLILLALDLPSWARVVIQKLSRPCKRTDNSL